MKIYFLLFILLISTAPFSRVNNDGSIIVQQNIISFDRFANEDFYRLIDIESKKRIEQLSLLLEKDELKGLEKIRQYTVDIVKKKNPIKHIKHLFITHGVGAGISAIVSEVVTVIIMPPIFISAGLPNLAFLSAASPSPALSIGLYLYFAKKWQRVKLMKALGLSNYQEIERFRTDLLGRARDSKILSITLNELGKQHEVTIIKRRFEKFRPKLKANNISFNELNNLAKKFPKFPNNSEQELLHKKSLSLIKEVAGSNLHLHTVLLVNYIRQSPEAEMQLAKIIKQRYVVTDITIDLAIKKELAKIGDKVMAVNKLNERILRDKEIAISEVKNMAVDKGIINSIKKYYDNMIVDLKLLEVQIKRHEYLILSSLLDGNHIDLERLRKTSGSILDEYRFISKKQQDLKGKIRRNELFELAEEKISFSDKIKKRLAIFPIYNRCTQLINSFMTF